MASILARAVLGAGLAAAVMAGAPAGAGAQPAPGPGAPPTAGAGAQPPGDAAAASDADRQAAKQLTDEAIAAGKAGDHDRAIDLYKQAYARIPHPLLLANIALEHRDAGRLDEALTYYERYLEADPEGAKAAAARAAIDELKAAGATSRPDLDRPAPPAAPPPQVQPPAPPARADTARRPGRSLRVAGLALGGAGIASVAVGAYFGMRVLGLESEAKDYVAAQNPTEQMLKDKYQADGDAAARNQIIAYGVAGALVLGGAVTYWLGYRQGRATPTTAWTPLVAPGFAGLALTGALP